MLSGSAAARAGRADLRAPVLLPWGFAAADQGSVPDKERAAPQQCLVSDFLAGVGPVGAIERGVQQLATEDDVNPAENGLLSPRLQPRRHAAPEPVQHADALWPRFNPVVLNAPSRLLTSLRDKTLACSPHSWFLHTELTPAPHSAEIAALSRRLAAHLLVQAVATPSSLADISDPVFALNRDAADCAAAHSSEPGELMDASAVNSLPPRHRLCVLRHLFEGLIACGADLNGTDECGSPALQAALEARDAVLALALLQAGADPNVSFCICFRRDKPPSPPRPAPALAPSNPPGHYHRQRVLLQRSGGVGKDTECAADCAPGSSAPASGAKAGAPVAGQLGGEFLAQRAAHHHFHCRMGSRASPAPRMHMLRWLAFYGMPAAAAAREAGVSVAECRAAAAGAGPTASIEASSTRLQSTAAPVRRGQPGPPLFMTDGAASSVVRQGSLAAGSSDGGLPVAESSASPDLHRAWSQDTVVALLRHAIFHGADALHSRPHQVLDVGGPESIATGQHTSEAATTGGRAVAPLAASTWVLPFPAAHRGEGEGLVGDAVGPDVERQGPASEEAEVAGRRAAQLLAQHPPARRARRNAIAFHSALAPVQLPLALQVAAAEDRLAQAEHDEEAAVGAAAPPRSPPGPPPQPYDSTGLSFVAALHRYLLPSNPALYNDICQRAVYGGMRDRCWVRRRAILLARDRAEQAWKQRHNDSPTPRGSVAGQ